MEFYDRRIKSLQGLFDVIQPDYVVELSPSQKWWL
jgi:hypothetical protein